MIIGPTTRLFTLIGDPVSHSLSPLVHNTAFGELSQDAVYVGTRVPRERLADAVRGLAALGFRGANVTIPHKLAVMDHLDEVTGTAKRIGAVNAILITRNDAGVRLTGDNTDAAGFAGPLLSGGVQAPRSALILGAGGSSRAVLYACLELLGVADVAVSARRIEQAKELTDRFSNSGVRTVAWTDRAAAAGEADLIVNCTPLGMRPNVDGSPLEDLTGVGSGHIVYDLVYAPSETRLLRESAKRGARTISGIEMLVGQAAVAFEWWTGRRMPLEAVRKIVHERVAGK